MSEIEGRRPLTIVDTEVRDSFNRIITCPYRGGGSIVCEVTCAAFSMREQEGGEILALCGFGVFHCKELLVIGSVVQDDGD